MVNWEYATSGYMWQWLNEIKLELDKVAVFYLWANKYRLIAIVNEFDVGVKIQAIVAENEKRQLNTIVKHINDLSPKELRDMPKCRKIMQKIEDAKKKCKK